MRISDWSSDVCSSDLQGRRLARAAAALVVEAPERPVVLLLAGRRQLGGRAVGRREAVGEAVEQAHDGDARADALACRLTWLRACHGGDTDLFPLRCDEIGRAHV